MSVGLTGYRGKARSLLKATNIEIGDLIRVTKEGVTYEGIVIPRSELGDDKHIVVKINSGYNIGIEVTESTFIERINSVAKPSFNTPSLPIQKRNLPGIMIASTGGTIASRVDYRTGAVRPAVSASELYSIVPELSDIARVDTEILFSAFSEDLTPMHWTEMAKSVARYINSGMSGVVISHGTDTMGYTAAALSFALQKLPIPVVLVGAQRSEDRPSSDAATNLVGALVAATLAPFAEVVVGMHETISDNAIAFHRGTRVRKLHTSRRDAFKTVSSFPLARSINRNIIMLTDDFEPRGIREDLVLKPNFEEKVALVKFHPNMKPYVINWYLKKGYKGIVFEGTGLGHINRKCFSAIKDALDHNVIIAMASQCIYGQVNMNVYANGRDLLSLGVIPLKDMLAETALVKLMWCLGQTEDIEEAKKLLLLNIAREISPRSITSIPNSLNRN